MGTELTKYITEIRNNKTVYCGTNSWNGNSTAGNLSKNAQQEILDKLYILEHISLNNILTKDMAITAICNACTLMSTQSKMTCPYRQGLYGGCVEVEAIKAIGGNNESFNQI